MNAIINKDSIGLYMKGSLRTVKADHPYFENIKQALKDENYSLVEELVDKVKQINAYGKGHIVVNNGEVTYKGNVLSNHLTRRITQLMREGFAVENLVNFIENLYQNPSKRAVDELYTFLENFSLPITEDGCFLAYKAVKNDFRDIYSGKFDNSIGQSPEMERNFVDEDRNNHCSAGLHVGAIGYVKQYGNIQDKPIAGDGNRVMIVKVNPRDAVSVPADHGCAKLRTCKYTVLAEMADYDKVLENAVYTSDAHEKSPEESPVVRMTSNNDDDELYFDGRRDGQLDAESGIPYMEPVGKPSKYIRGYKNGYKKVGFSI
jgi:hypothetical protein